MTSRRLLLVEDDPALGDYLRGALQADGFDVHLAPSRALALAALAGPQPARLVLLDLGLPPLASSLTEGLAVLTEGLLRVPEAKFIVLTGQDDPGAALQAIRAGAFDFLLKPAPMQAIFQALQRAELFVREEARLADSGEARLQLTARLNEGPKEAGSHAEEQLLRRVFSAAGYNVAETARQLGLAREHVYYYLNKYGIRRHD